MGEIMIKKKKRKNLGDVVGKLVKSAVIFGGAASAFLTLYFDNAPYKEIPIQQPHTINATGTILHVDVDAKKFSFDGPHGYRTEYRIWIKGNDGNVYYIRLHDTDWNKFLYKRKGLDELKPGDEVFFSGKIESYRIPRNNFISKRKFPEEIIDRLDNYYPVYYADVGKY